MELLGAVIALAIIAALAILVVIPILAVCLYLQRRKQDQQVGERKQRISKIQHEPSAIKQYDSLPCRLKKRATLMASNNDTRSAGESGVYDMAELSHLETKKDSITVSYTDADGKVRRLRLHGDLSNDEILSLRAVIAQYMSQDQCLQSICTDGDTKVFNLENVVITGLPPPTVCYENEGFINDENECANTRKASSVSQTLLSAIRKKKNKQRISRNSNKGVSVAHDEHSYPSCIQQSQTIGPSGGEITLEGGLTLTVPADALTEPTKITFGVSYDSKHRPQLSEEETLLTPIVFCQPSGLKFISPATICLPHCVERLQEDWRVNILRSDTDVLDTEMQWKQLSIGDYESRSFNKTSVELCVNHFTLYCLSGSPKQTSIGKKRMKLIALSLDSEPQNLSVFCVNSYSQMPMFHGQVLTIESSGQSVKISVDNLNSNIAQHNTSENELTFQSLWQDGIAQVKLTFWDVKGHGDLGYTLSCDVSAWQVGNTSPKNTIALKSSPPETSQAGNGQVKVKKHHHIFAEPLRWDIMLLLDSSHGDDNDWKKLAEELGCSEHMIQDMEKKPSPTKELLRVWEENGHGCIRSFVAMVVRINRLDVAEKIEDHVGKLYLETLPNHKCDDHC